MIAVPLLALSFFVGQQESLSLGEQLFIDRGCPSCHQLAGWPELPPEAPNLTNLGHKLRREWLFTWLLDPSHFDARIHAPTHYLTPVRGDEDPRDLSLKARALSAFLLSKAGKLATNNSPVATSAEKSQSSGEELFQNLACAACHDGHKEAALNNIGSKVNQGWLFEWLSSPPEHGSRMPNFRLSKNESAALALWLSQRYSERFEPRWPTLDRYAVDKSDEWLNDMGISESHGVEANLLPQGEKDQLLGAALFQKLHCGGCHQSAAASPAKLTLAAQTYPGWPDREAHQALGLNPTDADAITTALCGTTWPGQKGALLLYAAECDQCHQGALANETQKVRAEWLVAYLQRPTDRPHHARMPTYDWALPSRDSALQAVLARLLLLAPPEYLFEATGGDLAAEAKGKAESQLCQHCHRSLAAETERLRPSWLKRFIEGHGPLDATRAEAVSAFLSAAQPP